MRTVEAFSRVFRRATYQGIDRLCPESPESPRRQARKPFFPSILPKANPPGAWLGTSPAFSRLAAAHGPESRALRKGIRGGWGAGGQVGSKKGLHLVVLIWVLVDIEYHDLSIQFGAVVIMLLLVGVLFFPPSICVLTFLP